MNISKKVILLLLITVVFAGCSAIRQKFAAYLGKPDTTLSIVSAGEGVSPEGKKELYKAVRKMIGPSSTVILYDASGSMIYDTQQNLRRYELAYKGLTQIAGLFGEDDKIWLLVFGSKVPFELTKDRRITQKNYEKAFKSHTDVISVYDGTSGYDHAAFMSAIRFLGSRNAYIGDTPIGYAVLKAGEILKSVSGGKIILITDGEETGPILADGISRNKAWEDELREKYPHYDEVTISAASALDRVTSGEIYFTPILCGLENAGGNRVTTDGEIEKIRLFYENLAQATGSIVLQVSSAEGLVSAFIDAELVSLGYEIYRGHEVLPEKKVGEGHIGVPVKLDAGKYRVVANTNPPTERDVVVKGGKSNIYVLIVDSDGLLQFIPY
ncbi:MAG: hypothetical protein B6245_05220 [Desulfobacteraceae bacterium 4572_88]|nr:MAG: hypothetical protein B6245_05220 [Desulfobacteraceae bacterium 4572_88]